ncbi:hypothetical protein [Nocardia jiangxiensis]|uniref:hypothetical protein n=1 Tax=Nocardia jiangxiensis TaxID=282685 RepID=UPI0002E3AC71|nr:hypothetical protein [Nocardia jiangxiensis]
MKFYIDWSGPEIVPWWGKHDGEPLTLDEAKAQVMGHYDGVIDDAQSRRDGVRDLEESDFEEPED